MIPEFVNFCFCDFETTGVDVNSFDSDTYPIEIGCIFTDHNLMIKDTYKTLIKWNNFVGKIEWTGDMKDAYNIHKIELTDILSYGKPTIRVVSDLANIILDNFSGKTTTIISDNASFETYCMRKLFNSSQLYFENYFHYTSWDINLFLKAANIDRLNDHSHRALDDAASMYHQTLRALQKIGYFD